MSTFSYIPSSIPSIPMGDSHNDAIKPFTPHRARRWEMVGASDPMKRLRLQIRHIGPHFRTVLISGESGTGKETAARALHRLSPGADGPFLASTPGNRIGYLMKLARRGTLYFDRINEMPLDTQDELLDLLSQNDSAHTGLAAPQRMHPRIIASTNQDLRPLAATGRFRNNLYQRIAMLHISLPALRERMEDISVLATHFLGQLARPSCRDRDITITTDAMNWLKSYAWPGNIRELENMLQQASLHAEGAVIETSHLLPLTEDFNPLSEHVRGQSESEPARLQDVVKQHVLLVLKNCAGNKLQAAELLGISRSTLYRMLSACSPESAT